jgi:hypothetical protein
MCDHRPLYRNPAHEPHVLLRCECVYIPSRGRQRRVLARLRVQPRVPKFRESKEVGERQCGAGCGRLKMSVYTQMNIVLMSMVNAGRCRVDAVVIYLRASVGRARVMRR